MSNAEHATIGLVIGAFFKTIGFLVSWHFWLLYSSIAMLSHLMLDAIPHGHYFVYNSHSFKKNKKEFWLEVYPNMAFIAVVFPLLLSKGLGHFSYYFWGMFWANAVDLLSLKFNLFIMLNSKCHWFERKNQPVKNGWKQYVFRHAALILCLWLLHFFLL